MDAQRKVWNARQQALRRALLGGEEHGGAVELFLQQHAAVHAAEVSAAGEYSFADEVWHGLDEPAARCIPAGGEHSIAWVFWHLARIEDVTMNLLLAGRPQVFSLGGWSEALRAATRDTGNALDAAGIAALSRAVDIQALRAYRSSVGRQTRALVQQLRPEDFRRKVEPARLQRALAEGAVTDATRGLLDYWGGLTLAGLLLMPPTRHNFVHLNEAQRIRKKV